MQPYVTGQDLFNVIQKALPDFVEAEYPVFVQFVDTFLHFLEQPRVMEATEVHPTYGSIENSTVLNTATLGESAYELRKLQEYRDICCTLDEFRPHFLQMFAKNWPQRTHIPADLFVHSLRQFYKEKGTTDTLRWFFRTVFNEHADVHFPREDVLRASDATWIAPLTLKVSVPLFGRPNGDVTAYYSGQRVVTATGAAQVERVVTNVYGRSYNRYVVVNELTLKFGSLVGTFTEGQDLYNIDSDEVVHTTILPVISGVIVNSGGSNYEVGDLVEFSEGPGLGEGYGASGRVSRVSNLSLNGVLVLDGGEGFIVGAPVTFISSSGSGATAVVDEVVYGNIVLEDGTEVDSGPVYAAGTAAIEFLITEDQSAQDLTYWALEDKNTIDLLLTIEEFIIYNSGAGLPLNADFGLAVGTLTGVTLDSYIETVMNAVGGAPFMHPWVFTDDLETTVQLANLAALMTMTTNTFFANGQAIFALANTKDIVSTVGASVVNADIIICDTQIGNTQNYIYLANIAGLASFTIGTTFKQEGTGVLQAGTVTSNGTANVVGVDTLFTLKVKENSHLCITGTGDHIAVASVVNNTFLIAAAPVATAANSTYAIVPTGTIAAVDPQAQRYYGKIRHVAVTNPGTNYTSKPAASVDALSARAQAVEYWDGDEFKDPLGGIDIYSPASLDVQQDTGQVTRIEVLTSGVNYTDANAVVLNVIHGGGRSGDQATGTPILGALTQYAGRFTTTRGFLSSDKVLQDGEIYNDYTYQIRVGESFDRYSGLLTKLIHPAGFKMLGQFVAVMEAGTSEGALSDFGDPDVIVNVEQLS